MRHFIALLLLYFGFVGCAPDKKKTEETPLTIEQEKLIIKTTLVYMWDAIEQGDVERYAGYVHPDFTQFGETDPVLRVGKKAEVKGVSDWIENSTGIHTEMDEPLITVKGNVAWITYYWRDEGVTNGVPFKSRGKSTRIFVKEGGKWLCIHGHYTLL
ncbi:YybH family protein [Flagellimonas sp. 2504JD1-5]